MPVEGNRLFTGTAPYMKLNREIKSTIKKNINMNTY